MVPPVGSTVEGWQIYERAGGWGFSLVVEGQRGGANVPLEDRTFVWNPGDPTALPGVQILASRPLGNGSASVCDDTPPTAGGIPGLLPQGFDGSQAVADGLNDLGCRFKDGVGQRRGRQSDSACTSRPDGVFSFVVASSSLQYCAAVTSAFAFPPGETVLSARIVDVLGNVSAPRTIVVRIVD